MKETNLNKLIPVVLFIVFGLFTTCNPPESEDKADYLSPAPKGSPSVSKPKLKLKKETPSPKTCESNMGKIPTNSNGDPARKPNQFTKMKDLLKEGGCDLIEISYIYTFGNKYPDMPMRLEYNRIKRRVVEVYVKTNVREVYNDITEKGLFDFLQDGNTSLISIGDYSFDNTQMYQTALGDKPIQSEWDGTVPLVKDLVKSTAYDDSSIEFLEWSMISEFGKYWVVRAKYKGTNAIGVQVTENTWFYIQNNSVVDSKPL